MAEPRISDHSRLKLKCSFKRTRKDGLIRNMAEINGRAAQITVPHFRSLTHGKQTKIRYSYLGGFTNLQNTDLAEHRPSQQNCRMIRCYNPPLFQCDVKDLG